MTALARRSFLPLALVAAGCMSPHDPGAPTPPGSPSSCADPTVTTATSARLSLFDAGGFDGALCVRASAHGTVEVVGYAEIRAAGPLGMFRQTFDSAGAPARSDVFDVDTSACGFDASGELVVLTGFEQLAVRRIGRTGDDVRATTVPLLVPMEANSGAWVTGFAVDAGGNAFVAGNYGAPRDVEAALSKIDAGGGVAWTRLISTPSFDFLADVAVDAGGNAFAIGFTSGGGFVRKYSGEGDVLWTSPLDPSGGSVAVDSAGRSYVTSYTWPTLQVTAVRSRRRARVDAAPRGEPPRGGHRDRSDRARVGGGAHLLAGHRFRGVRGAHRRRRVRRVADALRDRRDGCATSRIRLRRERLRRRERALGQRRCVRCEGRSGGADRVGGRPEDREPPGSRSTEAGTPPVSREVPASAGLEPLASGVTVDSP